MAEQWAFNPLVQGSTPWRPTRENTSSRTVRRGTDCGTDTPSRVIVLSWPRPAGGYIQQLPSGSFRVSVYAGTDPLTGRQIRLRKTCKTERAAQIELGRLLEQAAAGRQPETDATVAQLMDRYAEVADWDLSTRKANEVCISKERFVLVRARARQSRKLVDATGTPVWYTSGRNFERSARASISFPDGRSLRFPVRGTHRANAIMTAVDEAGNSVARYRITRLGRSGGLRNNVEVAVHPGWELTGELVLAITISAPWLSSYFSVQWGGGGMTPVAWARSPAGRPGPWPAPPDHRGPYDRQPRLGCRVPRAGARTVPGREARPFG